MQTKRISTPRATSKIFIFTPQTATDTKNDFDKALSEASFEPEPSEIKEETKEIQSAGLNIEKQKSIQSEKFISKEKENGQENPTKTENIQNLSNREKMALRKAEFEKKTKVDTQNQEGYSKLSQLKEALQSKKYCENTTMEIIKNENNGKPKLNNNDKKRKKSFNKKNGLELICEDDLDRFPQVTPTNQYVLLKNKKIKESLNERVQILEKETGSCLIKVVKIILYENKKGVMIEN